MKALICDNGSIRIVEKDIPKIQDNKDAIVKVTYTTICTSDLHIMHKAVPRAEEGVVLGHEFVGEVVEVGTDVSKIKKGDRVTVNCITFCGECYFCQNGFINNCEKGGWEWGCRIDGGQAEYVRIPYADMGLTKIPDGVSDKDALFVGDILSSGYFGVDLCETKQGDTIAIIGCGPVGLCAMACAKAIGAKVIAIDIDENRLKIAKNQNLADYFLKSDDTLIKKIKEITQNRGADGVVEAAGGENTFELAWQIARPNSVVALVAMYENAQEFPLQKMYGKNLIFKTGGVDAIHCEKLLKMIAVGQISTNFLITHEYNFADILEAYKLFEDKSENCLKIAVKF